MCEWDGHAGASARRLQLRVTTPLASTAIIHLLTSFQNIGVTIHGPGANQNGPILVRKVTRDALSRTDATIISPGQSPGKRKNVAAFL